MENSITPKINKNTNINKNKVFSNVIPKQLPPSQLLFSRETTTKTPKNFTIKTNKSNSKPLVNNQNEIPNTSKIQNKQGIFVLDNLDSKLAILGLVKNEADTININKVPQKNIFNKSPVIKLKYKKNN